MNKAILSSEKSAGVTSAAASKKKGVVPPTSESIEAPRQRKSIQSVEIGVRVLKSLVSTETGRAPLREIADKAAMSRSQAHRYLLSFINTGMVVQERNSGLYSLGPIALEIGLSAAFRLDVIQAAADELRGLVEAVGTTGILSIWAEHGPTLVRWIDGKHPVLTSLTIGSVLPLLTSSAGMVFLSFQAPARVATVLEAELSARLKVDRRELAERVRKTREAGYATVAGDLIPGLSAITAPVFDMQGWPAATLGLLGYSWDQNFLTQSNIRLMLAAAQRASFAIGWTLATGTAISRVRAPDFP